MKTLKVSDEKYWEIVALAKKMQIPLSQATEIYLKDISENEKDMKTNEREVPTPAPSRHPVGTIPAPSSADIVPTPAPEKKEWLNCPHCKHKCLSYTTLRRHLRNEHNVPYKVLKKYGFYDKVLD